MFQKALSFRKGLFSGNPDKEEAQRAPLPESEISRNAVPAFDVGERSRSIGGQLPADSRTAAIVTALRKTAAEENELPGIVAAVGKEERIGSLPEEGLTDARQEVLRAVKIVVGNPVAVTGRVVDVRGNGGAVEDRVARDTLFVDLRTLENSDAVGDIFIAVAVVVVKESGGLVADAVGPGLRIVVDTANPVGAADVRTRIAVEPLVDTADIEKCALGPR